MTVTVVLTNAASVYIQVNNYVFHLEIKIGVRLVLSIKTVLSNKYVSRLTRALYVLTLGVSVAIQESSV